MDASTFQRWFASTASATVGPISSRAILQRRKSSSILSPTLSFMVRKPSLTARLASRASFSDRKSTRLNSSHTVIYTLSLHDALPICDPAAAQVVFDIESDFELYGAKAVFDRPPGQPCELLVGVSEPTRRRRVRRITERIQRRNALRLAGCGRSQNRQRLRGREGVGNVAKVDQIDDLLGTHVGNQPPDGFPAVTRGHVPGS